MKLKLTRIHCHNGVEHKPGATLDLPDDLATEVKRLHAEQDAKEKAEKAPTAVEPLKR